MEKTENPVFGRKVFFINPPIRIQSFVIEGLREQEYEVYSIPDYKTAKHILQANRDALCFIYIDAGLNYEQWYKYIRSFEEDEILKTVFVGIISDSISEKKKNFFLVNTTLPGGFIIGNEGSLEELFRKVKDILDVNGAKGRRQYIRLNCKNRKDIYAYLTHGTKLLSLTIDDISTAGMAVRGSASMATLFTKGTVIPNLSLTIERKTFVISSVVLNCGLDETGKNCKIVLLTPSLKDVDKNVIRNFIFEIMDSQFKEDLRTALIDKTDYDKFEIPEESSILGSVKDLLEASNESIESQIISTLEAFESLEPM